MKGEVVARWKSTSKGYEVWYKIVNVLNKLLVYIEESLPGFARYLAASLSNEGYDDINMAPDIFKAL